MEDAPVEPRAVADLEQVQPVDVVPDDDDPRGDRLGVDRDAYLAAAEDEPKRGAEELAFRSVEDVLAAFRRQQQS